MTSKQRNFAALEGKPVDHIPLTTWCFGFPAPAEVRWEKDGKADAGVDLLWFVDPVQDGISLEKAKELLGGRMTLVGGTNALSLASGDPERIRGEVRRAVEVLGPTNRFILHPVDGIFPDTPWVGVKTLIDAWKQVFDG